MIAKKVTGILLAAAAISLTSSSGFAQASETRRHVIITGKVIVENDCVETGLAIKPRAKAAVCLGSNDLGLAVGATYYLGGELTEDGFFPNEFLN